MDIARQLHIYFPSGPARTLQLALDTALPEVDTLEQQLVVAGPQRGRRVAMDCVAKDGDDDHGADECAAEASEDVVQ